MKIACPHCSQNLELDPETLAALQGQPHFSCPTCEGLMAVPEVAAPPMRPGPRQPRPNSVPPQKRAAVAQKGRGGKSSLIGIAVLLLLGGAAFYFWPGGSKAKGREVSVLHAQQDRKASLSLRPAFEKFGLKPTTQGYNACTVFATLGVIEFDYAREGTLVKFSEQFAQWAAVESAGRRYLNFPYRTVISGIQKHGLCREVLMPYQDPRLDLGKPSEAALLDAEKRRNVSVVLFHEYNKSFGFAENVITAMCDSLADEKAVVCCIRWPQNDAAARKAPHTFDTKNSRADLRFTSQGGIGHAVMLVGYERNSQWEGGGRFEFRNSFGESWGQKGYGWVTFEYVKTHGVMAYAVHGAPE